MAQAVSPLGCGPIIWSYFFSHGKGLQLTHQPEMSLSGHQRCLSSLMGKGTDRSWLKSPLPVLPHPFCQPIRRKRETFSPSSPSSLLPQTGGAGGLEDAAPRPLSVPCRHEGHCNFPGTLWRSRPLLHKHHIPTTRFPTEQQWQIQNYHLQISNRPITGALPAARGTSLWRTLGTHAGT